MKLNKKLSIISNFFIFIIILIKSLECNKLLSNFEGGENFPLVINYYPNVFLNLMNNKVNLTVENKIKIAKTVNHTRKCENYLNFLFDKVVDYTNDDKSEKYSSLKSSISLVNNWYENNFVKMIVDGDEASSNNCTEMHTKFIEANAQPTKYLLDDIYTFIHGNPTEATISVEELLKSVAQIHREDKRQDHCDSTMTLQHHLYNAYNCLSLTMLNSYSMAFYNFQVHKEKSETIYISKHSNLNKRRLKEKLLLLAWKSKSEIRLSLQNLRRCDPQKYQEGINYLQLKHFLHVHVIGKDMLTKPHNCIFNTCENFLQSLPSSESDGMRYQCNGHLFHCWKTSVNNICFPPNNSNSSRHYQAFKTEDGNEIGPWTEECQGNNVANYEAISKYKSFILKHSSGFFSSDYEEKKCDICACYCDDKFSPNTVRKFSLQQVQAKHSQGVVTGIKFDIDQDTIILKIRVGILANGTVDANQQSWDSNYVAKFNPGGLPPNLVNGTPAVLSDIFGRHPYETIKLDFNWRNVYLDNLVAPPGKVIQGVKFVACDEGISISILATSLNEGGAILPETAEWYSGCDRQLFPNERVEVRAPINANVPTKGRGTNKIISKPHTYVAFQVSGWSIDASQTVIPFIDAQQVITDPPVPLSAIGIHYKAHDNYGGFIGFHIQPFNPSYFMDEDILDGKLNKLITFIRKPRNMNKKVVQ